MRKNKFSSASDRRWQRRYERIQQRKEAEQYHQYRDALAEYFGITSTPGEEESARLRAVAHDYSELRRQIEKDWKDYIQSHAAEWFDAFVDVKDIGLGDRAIFSFDISLAPDIQEAELDTGDTDILDSFLGEFLLQGA